MPWCKVRRDVLATARTWNDVNRRHHLPASQAPLCSFKFLLVFLIKTVWQSLFFKAESEVPWEEPLSATVHRTWHEAAWAEETPVRACTVDREAELRPHFCRTLPLYGPPNHSSKAKQKQEQRRLSWGSVCDAAGNWMRKGLVFRAVTRVALQVIEIRAGHSRDWGRLEHLNLGRQVQTATCCKRANFTTGCLSFVIWDIYEAFIFTNLYLLNQEHYEKDLIIHSPPQYNLVLTIPTTKASPQDASFFSCWVLWCPIDKNTNIFT